MKHPSMIYFSDAELALLDADMAQQERALRKSLAILDRLFVDSQTMKVGDTIPIRLPKRYASEG